ncbi:DNA polymerase [Cytobacillus phage Bfsp1]|nr:DNA polymerase [Cytobacillus phage Bfsp1]
MARKQFMCDFETTTDIDDCRVWAYGYMEIGNKQNYKIGNSIEEFMEWAEKSRSDIYFHNLKFDGSFIVNWLLNNGYTWEHMNEKSGKPKTFTTIISNMGQWYMVDICYGRKGKRLLHTKIYDSLKKLPFSVKQIAKAFKLPIMKGDIDYTKPRPVGYEITPDEEEYIYGDLFIVASALETQFEQGLTKMTSGSDSLSGFKDILTPKMFDKFFPVLDLRIDSEIRKAYRGGFTWVNDTIQGQTIGEGMVFDVNSLYPSRMYDCDLPYGTPEKFEGEYTYNETYPLYIQVLKCSFELKEGYIPTIQLKQTARYRDNEYLKSSNHEIETLYVTNVDLELIKEHYDLYDVEYLGGYMFKKKNDLFREFIDYWMHIKITSTGAIKQLAKLMLNSLYGKFASNPVVTGKIPYLKEDGRNGFKLPVKEGEFQEVKGKLIPVIDEEYKEPVYTAMGAFITAWARHYTITTAQKCFDRICYCDTDSIHIKGTEIPEVIKDIIDPDKLGYWNHESTFIRAKFIRQKTYIEDTCFKMVEKNGKLEKVGAGLDDYEFTEIEVKCAGMPENLKKYVTWENFNVFNEDMLLPARDGYWYGKLMPKQVPGGVVLVESDFAIR